MVVIQEMSIQEIFKRFKLDEHTTYLVEVKISRSNVEHKAILFTGFETGGYCTVYTNSYDMPIDLNKVYSMKVIKKLVKL